MFSTKNGSLNRLFEIPLTLADISEDIFGGISTRNDFLHKMSFRGKNDPLAPYMCQGLCRPVNAEEELVYPYVSGTNSCKYAFPPASLHFLLPYEQSGRTLKPVQPAELKVRFPLTYGRIQEFKEKFHHKGPTLDSADYYSVRGKKLLEYLGTPKIIVTEHYGLQAAYDTVGTRLFGEGCGIVLKDPEKAHYVTAVLNSPIAKQLPELCKRENLYCNNLSPETLKLFPIAFPEDELAETLVSILSRCLGFLQEQKYAEETVFGPSARYDELIGFYRKLTDLLVLESYFTNNLDPNFLEVLEEDLGLLDNCFESESHESLLWALEATEQSILGTCAHGKFRLKIGIENLLSLPKYSQKSDFLQ